MCVGQGEWVPSSRFPTLLAEAGASELWPESQGQGVVGRGWEAFQTPWPHWRVGSLRLRTALLPGPHLACPDFAATGKATRLQHQL